MLRSAYIKLPALVLSALLFCTGCQLQLGFPNAETTSAASSEAATTAGAATSAGTTTEPHLTTVPTPGTSGVESTVSETLPPATDATVTDAPVPELPPVPTKRVAFTFDDGPHATLTYKFVDKLKEYGATATFFVVGNNITKSRGAAMAYAAENGCEIGIHSYTHTSALYYDRCTDEEYLRDMQQTADAINRYVSAPVTLMRPPGGNITAARVASCPYSVILWNVDSNDWRYKSRTDEATIRANINTIVENVMSTVDDGDIVLMHEIYENSYEAFCIIIERLYAEGYEIVSVTELLGDSLQPGKKYSRG
ncbi:MAG: polysaccharide deacetylase family protein [Clostridia bacterium]|nr:polysaccharide deacetylase family protein [Clostridia bacterium]